MTQNDFAAGGFRVLNVAAFAAMCVASYFNPFRRREDHEDTHLSPARHTYAVWGVIFTLLGGFLIYQWSPRARDVVVAGVGWRFAVVAALHVSWLHCWSTYDSLGSNAVIILIQFAMLLHLCRNLTYYPPHSAADRVFIRWPFHIYATWVGIATLLNLWLAWPNTFDSALLSNIAIVLVGNAGLYLVDGYNHRHVVPALIIVWSLVGIAANHRRDKSIFVSSLVMTALVSIAIVRVWANIAWEHYRARARASETSPLLDNV